jgi:hypothetical protein
MAVGRTGDDRTAPARPKPSEGRPKERLSWSSREWALSRTLEENEPAVADADRTEHREEVFGQTCPIETAVDVPAGR